MTTDFSGIIGAYNREAPGDVGASRGLTPERLVPMPSQDTLPLPTPSTSDIERFARKVRKDSECWTWIGSTKPDGYGQFYLGGKMRGAHRVAWLTAYGSIPRNMLVCHKCDNPTCVRPDHLFLGTDSDNAVDMVRKGRKYIMEGEQNSHAKLCEKDVSDIRQLHQTGGFTYVDIAKVFKVSPTTIGRIVRGQYWKNVGQEALAAAVKQAEGQE